MVMSSVASMAPVADRKGHKINITEDVRRILPCRGKVDYSAEKIRMLKWFEATPFHGMLNYREQKNIELQVSAGRSEATMKTVRCGVRMNHDFACLILNKAGFGWSPQDAVFICFESEVKKLNKNAARRWLACISTKNFEKKTKDLEVRRDMPIKEAFKAFAHVQPSKFPGGLPVFPVPDINETYTIIALLTEEGGSIFVTTERQVLDLLLFKPSDEVIRFCRARDDWLSIAGSAQLVSVDFFEANSKLLNQDREKSYELSPSVKLFLAPNGMICPAKWCSLYAVCGQDVNRFKIGVDEEKVIMWDANNDDCLLNRANYYPVDVVEEKDEESELNSPATKKPFLPSSFGSIEPIQHESSVGEDKRAIQSYRQAADKGDADAMFKLGLCYFNGDGVSQDKKKAIELIKHAVDNDSADAMNCLAKLYLSGREIGQDKKKAIELFQRAVGLGNSDAMYNLGVCHFDADGVRQDKKTAILFFELAAGKGNVDALNRLGICYLNGDGKPEDEKKAKEYFQLAAKKGSTDAMHKLAESPSSDQRSPDSGKLYGPAVIVDDPDSFFNSVTEFS